MMAKEERERLQRQAADNAGEYFRQGLNCAESVYRGFYDLGLSSLPAKTVALATGFGGGIGHTKHDCGCVLGAVMAIGSVKGRQDPLEKETVKERIGQLNGPDGLYRIFGDFVREFEAQFGTIVCSELTSSYQDFNGKERKTSCLQLVRYAAGLAVAYALKD